MKKSNIVISLILIALITMFVVSPHKNMTFTMDGIFLWARALLPALFPFFFLTKLLAEFELIEKLSNLLAPVTKKLFGVSGIAAYAYIMSIISGYPVGAKITADLYESGKLSHTHACRTVTFTSTSGPMFVVGTVGIGMMLNAQVGIIALACHLAGAIINGIVFRKYTPKNNLHLSHLQVPPISKVKTHQQGVGIKALATTNNYAPLNINTTNLLPNNNVSLSENLMLNNAVSLSENLMQNANNNYQKNTYNKTQNNSNKLTEVKTNKDSNLLEKAMLDSIKSILIVGGYVTMFFLIITMLNNNNILTPINSVLNNIFSALNLPSNMGKSIVNGVIEITKGCYDLSLLKLNPKLSGVASTFIITFGGFSTHMQALTFLKRFNIKTSFYFVQKLCHTAIATTLSVIAFNIFM